MRKIRKPLWILLCAGILILIALNLQNETLLSLDLAVTRALAAGRTPLLTSLMKGASNACSPYVLLVICLALMYYFRRRHYSVPVAVNLMVSLFLNQGMKNYFLRSRPPVQFQLVYESGYSFPSAHAMAALAFYGFLIYLVWRSGMSARHKRVGSALLGALIALVGFSRVYLGAHYLSDVIAGFAAASVYLLAYTSLVSLYLRAGQEELMDQTKQHTKLRYSFLFALEGVAGGIKGERNMMLHFAMMALVTVAGFLFSISETEWLVCVILFGLVVGMEMMNTAIETVVDICMPHQDPRAKRAKDVAAGAVLLVSIAAAVAGCIIFLPKILLSTLG